MFFERTAWTLSMKMNETNRKLVIDDRRDDDDDGGVSDECDDADDEYDDDESDDDDDDDVEGGQGDQTGWWLWWRLESWLSSEILARDWIRETTELKSEHNELAQQTTLGQMSSALSELKHSFPWILLCKAVIMFERWT